MMGKMMKIVLKKSIKDETGQALILVVILLLVGSLIIAPLLGFMSTGLLAGQVFEKKMGGLYAADAGVEDALWQLINNPPASYPYSYSLPDVNEMLVSILIEEVTTFYVLDVGEGGTHNYYFELEGIYLGYTGGVHSYRLRLTNKTNSPVKVERIIVSYSNELSYLSGLTDEDTEGLKSGSFELFDQEYIYLDSTTILTWEFTPPRPEIEAAPDPDNGDYTTVTCTFELVGPEDAAGVTVLLVAAREDIGAVWEYKPFRITATAQADDGSTVVIEAGVLQGTDTVLVESWEIS